MVCFQLDPMLVPARSRSEHAAQCNCRVRQQSPAPRQSQSPQSRLVASHCAVVWWCRGDPCQGGRQHPPPTRTPDHQRRTDFFISSTAPRSIRAPIVNLILWRRSTNRAMLSPMWDGCRLIWSLLIGLFRSRATIQAENLVLRQQILVLRRAAPKRLSFNALDRVTLSGSADCFGIFDMP
jgi:hypothetical protein